MQTIQLQPLVAEDPFETLDSFPSPYTTLSGRRLVVLSLETTCALAAIHLEWQQRMRHARASNTQKPIPIARMASILGPSSRCAVHAGCLRAAVPKTLRSLIEVRSVLLSYPPNSSKGGTGGQGGYCRGLWNNVRREISRRFV
jgi:hypothetical protein